MRDCKKRCPVIKIIKTLSAIYNVAAKTREKA